MLNKELLQRVRDTIVAHKGKFFYKHIVSSSPCDHARSGFIRPKAKDILDESCGTVGCVCGFTMAVENCCVHEAEERLGLNHDEAGFLFGGCQVFGFDDYDIDKLRWPDSGYDEALKRIDYLLNRD